MNGINRPHGMIDWREYAGTRMIALLYWVVMDENVGGQSIEKNMIEDWCERLAARGNHLLLDLAGNLDAAL